MRRVLCLVVLVCVVQCVPMSKDELEDFSNFLLKTSSLDIHVKKGADPDISYDEEEVTSDHAWEESGKFEGDLILNDRQRRLIVENVEGLSRNGLSDSTKRWPGNEVVYFIQREHFSSGQVQAIEDGINDLGQASCVKFRPYKKGDRDAVVIQGSRRGCFSQVGYQGGYQVLNLSGRHPVGRGCFRHGTVVHELLHTLGFYHMQSSPDRDDYIDVVWANIVQPARHNFRKYNSFSVSDFGVGYDYDSVLHYSRRAFSANGQDTLVPKKSGAEIGQRVGLSDKDTQKLNKMYCDADNDGVQADENPAQKPKNKKKKPKNQPFEGHGIGYHQGKTVVIKLPAAETFKLPNVPSTPVFDFSKTPQVVSSPEAGGYRFGKEVTNPYKPIFSLNTETVMDYVNSYEVNPILNKNTEKQHPTNDDKAGPLNEDNGTSSPQHSKGLNEVKPEYVPIDKYDKDLKDAFYRLTKIVEQNVYPQNQGYGHKINKDYSTFYTPLQSKKTDTVQDSLDEKFKQQISYDLPVIILQKQIDAKRRKPEPFVNSNDMFKNNQFEDRMDTSYRTSLPAKKTYSSYMGTETPQYATLEYLKNRHDFTDIYAPKISHSDKHIDVSSLTDGDIYKQDYIKINPYDRGFYTDDVMKHRLNDDTREGNSSKEVKTSKYERTESPINKQLGSTNKQIDAGMDSSYRTLLPTKKPYSALEQTETPNYATLEYLKDRHDFSSLYAPKTADNENRKVSYPVVGDKPPTVGDWYKKDSYKHNPANYDRGSYSDYIQEHPSEHDKGENKGRILDASHYDDNSTESPKKTRNKYNTDNLGLDFYTKNGKANNRRINEDLVSYDNEDSKESSNEKQTKYNGKDYDHGYYDDYAKGDIGNLTDVQSDEDENDKESLKYDKSEQGGVDYDHDYYTDYTKQRNPSSERDSDNSGDKKLPNKSEPYKLYGVSVPLTKDWYKASYSIPGISSEDENSRSQYQDENR